MDEDVDVVDPLGIAASRILRKMEACLKIHWVS